MVNMRLISEAAVLHDGRQTRPEPHDLKGWSSALLSYAHILLKSKGCFRKDLDVFLQDTLL